jgi:ribosomal protein S18 acetylase RimI-like enzyme
VLVMGAQHRSSNEILIRSGTADEIGALLELWRDAETHPSATDDAAGLQALFDADPDGVLVAEDGRDIVGALIATFDGWRGNMYRLAVLPEHRRRGIATALVKAGESRLRSRGARRITALVAHEQPGASEFWGSARFELDPRTTRFVRSL